MFQNAGAETGAGGTINVHGSNITTWSTNASIDTDHWDINVINDEE